MADNETGFVTIPADGSGSPAHAPGSVVPTSNGLAPVLPSTEGLTGDQCRAQYRELMSPEKMQAMGRMTPGARNAEIAKGEALMRRAHELDAGTAKASGKPAGASGAPRYELAPGLSVEEKAAAVALAEREVALVDAGPEGQSEWDEAHAPKSANEYANLHSGVGRQLLLENGVSPIAVNFLVSQHRTYPENDAAYDVLADKAVDLVRRQPGGAKVLADAKKFLDGLKDGSPLLRAAVMAAAYPTGIAELARLHRRGARQ